MSLRVEVQRLLASPLVTLSPTKVKVSSRWNIWLGPTITSPVPNMLPVDQMGLVQQFIIIFFFFNSTSNGGFVVFIPVLFCHYVYFGIQTGVFSLDVKPRGRLPYCLMFIYLIFHDLSVFSCLWLTYPHYCQKTCVGYDRWCSFPVPGQSHIPHLQSSRNDGGCDIMSINFCQREWKAFISPRESGKTEIAVRDFFSNLEEHLTGGMSTWHFDLGDLG